MTLRVATPADAPELLRVIRAAFSARRPVDPPADALSDDVADIERALTEGQAWWSRPTGSPSRASCSTSTATW
ncbi:hypothetical protein G7085_15820 [Tessaracoccus sp. HDW20]|uniref:hypothetical protein n=1 Tax=Tessaracoccus coleopterorum TaxID=2714950 RepID=UPI0018D3AB7C|nr:hypothetical protein [Tessaracoccus coleopterorum]NHB85571.1 hypothetical protein [Tessaracoccus coleopterorum]